MLQVEHVAEMTIEENGAVLARAIQGLEPGDMLVIGSGQYSFAPKLAVDLQGTEKAPIWIVGADSDHLPIITRPDSNQNVVNVGERSRAQYVWFRHLELTGGSTLIRLGNGLANFVDVSWNGDQRDARLTQNFRFFGQADKTFPVPVDITGSKHRRVTAGAFDAP